MKPSIKNIVLLLIIISYLSVNAYAQKFAQKFEFAGKIASAKILNTEDDYVNSWSEFDINSRMHKTGATVKEVLQFMSEQTLNWSQSEKDKVIECLAEIQAIQEKNNFKLKIPDTVYIAITTGNEEAGADGYTRANYIFFPKSTIAKSKKELSRYIVHELFHVITRYDSGFRMKIYSTIGFEMCNDIKYPSAIAKYKISNPDAVKNDNYISLYVDDQKVDCLMVLVANKEYSSGDFFDYLSVGFIKLSGIMQKYPELKSGNPIIYSFNDVKGFWEKVGQNTQYVLSAEEIAAENFSFVWFEPKEVQNPEIIANIKRIMISGQ